MTGLANKYGLKELPWCTPLPTGKHFELKQLFITQLLIFEYSVLTKFTKEPKFIHCKVLNKNLYSLFVFADHVGSSKSSVYVKDVILMLLQAREFLLYSFFFFYGKHSLFSDNCMVFALSKFKICLYAYKGGHDGYPQMLITWQIGDVAK